MKYDLPLPKEYDREQMWRAMELLNRGSESAAAQTMRILHRAYETVRETSMSNLEPLRSVQGSLPDPVSSLPLVERNGAAIFQEKV